MKLTLTVISCSVFVLEGATPVRICLALLAASAGGDHLGTDCVPIVVLRTTEHADCLILTLDITLDERTTFRFRCAVLATHGHATHFRICSLCNSCKHSRVLVIPPAPVIRDHERRHSGWIPCSPSENTTKFLSPHPITIVGRIPKRDWKV